MGFVCNNIQYKRTCCTNIYVCFKDLKILHFYEKIHIILISVFFPLKRNLPIYQYQSSYLTIQMTKISMIVVVLFLLFCLKEHRQYLMNFISILAIYNIGILLENTNVYFIFNLFIKVDFLYSSLKTIFALPKSTWALT